jgi:hypothetical protein
MVKTSVGVHPQTPYAMIEGWKLWQELKPPLGFFARARKSIKLAAAIFRTWLLTPTHQSSGNEWIK